MTTDMTEEVARYFSALRIPQPNSHKGQNGKVLIIGGSELFHAASKWSLDIASKFVDMVFYASVPSNNGLIRQAKGEFWNGLVIELNHVEEYIEEADCILIGPGMTRTADVEELTNRLLKKYPDKKWVVDAGALQMVDPSLLNQNCIITPHTQEFSLMTSKLSQMVLKKYFKKVMGTKKLYTSPSTTEEFHYSYERVTAYGKRWLSAQSNFLLSWPDPGKIYTALKNNPDPHAEGDLYDLRWSLYEIALLAKNVTIILKGQSDIVICPGETCQISAADPSFLNRIVEIPGGNAGMTKGGTGDVLAGLVAALYATNDAMTAAVVASYANKKAGDELYKTVGPFFNASELVEAVPRVMWELVGNTQQS